MMKLIQHLSHLVTKDKESLNKKNIMKKILLQGEIQ